MKKKTKNKIILPFTMMWVSITNFISPKSSEGSVKEILAIALPLILSQASHTVLTFTDRMFLSWYSSTSIAASGPAAIFSFSIICFFRGTGSYVSTLTAQFYGAKKSSQISKVFWQGIYLVLISTLLIIALIPVGNVIIDHSGHSSAVIVQEKIYFDILMYGGGLVVLEAVLAAFFSGRGRTKVIMYTWFAGAVLNIIFDYVLIFGKLGVPEFGIAGAGIGTALAHLIVVTVYAVLIFQKKYRHKYRIHLFWRFNRELFFKLIRFGTPEGFHFFIDVAGFSAFIFFVGVHGEFALAASTLTIFVDMMAFMPMIGIGIATAVLTGQYIGKKKKDVAVRVTNNAMMITAFYGLIIGCLFWFIPDVFINCFKGNDHNAFVQITNEAKPLFRILPIFLMSDSLHILYGAALSGAGDTKFKMYVAALSAVFLYVPGEYFILKHWQHPAVYGWWWSILHLLVIGLVYMFRFRSQKWRKIDLIH